MKLKLLALTAVAALALSGCGSEEDVDDGYDEGHVHGEDERAVFFYSPTTKDHFAYDIHEELLINLDDANYTTDGNVHDISSLNLTASDSGFPYRWLDDKGDNNESNDEEKIVMFQSSYDFESNATFEDFFYMAYLHNDEDAGERHLEGLSNSEYNVTSGDAFDELARLHAFVIEENQLKVDLNASLNALGEEDLCVAYSQEDHEHNETILYAMDTNGTLHIFEDNTTNRVQTVVVSNTCSAQSAGISGVEDGVWVYLGGSNQTIYEVDSHDENDIHVHESFDVTSYIGSGAEAEVMVSIAPSEDEHDD
jgi:hypothetical protein